MLAALADILSVDTLHLFLDLVLDCDSVSSVERDLLDGGRSFLVGVELEDGCSLLALLLLATVLCCDPSFSQGDSTGLHRQNSVSPHPTGIQLTLVRRLEHLSSHRLAEELAFFAAYFVLSPTSL